ncbi:MAG TPA: tRNA (adenosine(37)-N6)-threonylcarbamoyltransferase complex transferase subunit TsaD [Gammaproteobacteria bacterium]|nr:tRNA (adenosine(37)-N6)-threonylcarbamoyltransferase complex transferase subunit TsaD [Gammaproteobacteria bacterium]
MRILGIETSCDETGVAVYEQGRGILAEALASQIAVHAPFGGVVPELASRDHIAKLAPQVLAVLAEAGLGLSDIDAVAYTAGPGLVGALMVGGCLASALAHARGIPVVPVHHMEGHLLASMLEPDPPRFPFLALLVSGGHSQLVAVERLGRYRIVGETLDDAAGEAFDKVARLLSLPYPGGPALAALAERGNAERFAFPRPLRGQGLDLSFSGLKTAVRLAVDAERPPAGPLPDELRADLAASFQAAVVDTLVDKCRSALEATGLPRLVVAGGVGANRRLRAALEALGRAEGVRVHYPRPALCTDNGAMIAYAGACRARDSRGPSGVVARPRWSLEELQPPAA